jgi:flagellin-like hook-associated protein FlgL
MRRVSENQIVRQLMNDIYQNRNLLNKYSNEVSSGLRVANPGDSSRSATISQQRDSVLRIENYAQRVENARSTILAQDNAVNSVNDRMTRLKEIATQAANESLSPENRQALAAEAYEIRDTLSQLANTRFLGSYVFSGAQNEPLMVSTADFFTDPAGVGERARRNVEIDPTLTGLGTQRTVRLGDNFTVDVNIDGQELFGYAVQAATRLARSLDGFRTYPELDMNDFGSTPLTVAADAAAAGAVGPDRYDADGNGIIEGAEFSQQTSDLQQIISFIEFNRSEHILPGLNELGGKMARAESAGSLLQINLDNARQALSSLQDADVTASATNLSLMQTSLEASMTVTSRALNLSILNFL